MTDPGRVVSRAAVNQFRTKVRDLADTMAVIDARIAGARHSENPRSMKPGSRPPLNLAVLAAVDDDRDTIDVWANNLAQHANPSLRYRPGDWVAIEQILKHYAHLCGHWHYGDSLPGVLCIQRVTAAIDHLERVADPNRDQPHLTELQRLNARDNLRDAWLTIGPACEAVRLITGNCLAKKTVYSWEYRGKIEGEGEPRRYMIQDLLDLASATRSEEV